MTSALTIPPISIKPAIRATEHGVLGNKDLVTLLFTYLPFKMRSWDPGRISDQRAFAHLLITSGPTQQGDARSAAIRARTIEVLQCWRAALAQSPEIQDQPNNGKTTIQAMMSIDRQLQQRGVNRISYPHSERRIVKDPDHLVYALECFHRCDNLQLVGEDDSQALPISLSCDWHLIPSFSHLRILKLEGIGNIPFGSSQWEIPLLTSLSLFNCKIPTLDFLTAPHLKDVSLQEHETQPYRNVLESLQKFPLEKLFIDGYQEEEPPFFPSLPLLKELCIQGGGLCNLPLSQPLPSLQTLFCPMEEESWNNLRYVPNLTCLKVDETAAQISPNHLSHLSSVPHLTCFHWDGYANFEELTRDHIRFLPPPLTDLKIAKHTESREVFADILKRCPHLTTLSCLPCPTEEEGGPDHSSVQRLAIPTFLIHLPDRLIPFLCRFPNLSQLEIGVNANSTPQMCAFAQVIQQTTLSDTLLVGDFGRVVGDFGRVEFVRKKTGEQYIQEPSGKRLPFPLPRIAAPSSTTDQADME